MKNTICGMVRSFIFKLLHRGGVKSGKNLQIRGALPYIKIPKLALGGICLGDNVILNSDAKNANTSTTMRLKFVLGYDGSINVGDYTQLNGLCIVSYKQIEIGECCEFGSNTMITDTDFHPVDSKMRRKQVMGEKYDFDYVKKEPIIIGNNVWIGWGCLILKGVTIGDNCIVAGNSVVLKGDYPPNSLIAGNPAKVVKTIGV